MYCRLHNLTLQERIWKSSANKINSRKSMTGRVYLYSSVRDLCPHGGDPDTEDFVPYSSLNGGLSFVLNALQEC